MTWRAISGGLHLVQRAGEDLRGGGLCVEGQEQAALQGLTLLHYSAQLEPCMTQKHTQNNPDTPYHPLNTPKQPLSAPHVTQKALKLS